MADVITTVIGLRILTTPDVNTVYRTTDNGQGSWNYYLTTGQIDDTALKVVNVATGGYFKRIYSGSINMEWYGIKADGSSDETALLQQALNTVPEHSTLYFPGRTISISYVTLQRNNLYLKGDHGATIQTNTTKEMFELFDCANIIFDGLSFVSAYVNTNPVKDSWGMFKSVQHSLTNITIKNCYFSNPSIYTNAITIAPEATGNIINGITITNCIFNNVGRMAIEFQSHTDTVTEKLLNINIIDNKFYNLGVVTGSDGSFGTALSLSGMGRNANINNNYLNNVLGIGIEITNGINYFQCNFNNFQKNSRSDPSTGIPLTYISIDGTSRNIEGQVTGNSTLDDLSYGRIYLWKLVNTTINNNNFNLSGQLYLREIQNCVFTDNYIESNNSPVIFGEDAGGSFQNNIFLNNTIRSTSVLSLQS